MRPPCHDHSLPDSSYTALLAEGVPVHAGADRPLVAAARHAPDIHGETGLFGVELPAASRRPEAVHAVQAILDASHRVAGLWLVAVGPLTNVALALALDPTLAQRLAGISVMGGGVGLGNTTPMAEFNFLVDPEAAQRVLQSGARVVVAGLDLTHQFCFGAADAAALRAAAAGRSPEAQARAAVVADIYAHFAERYFEVTGMANGPMHDPCAVLALTHPTLFEREPLHCEVELAGGTRGMLVADLRFPKLSANAEVLRRIAAQAAREVLAQALLDAAGP